jgi:CheY-like chemotaxis protein
MSTGGILIVEDSDDLRDAIAELLIEEGYEAVTASDGSEGLTKLWSGPPDLIITDFMMPCMDGVEFLRRVRADPAMCGIPAILMTAVGRAMAERLLGEAGVAALALDKPLDVDELLDTILRTLAAEARTAMPEALAEAPATGSELGLAMRPS